LKPGVASGLTPDDASRLMMDGATRIEQAVRPTVFNTMGQQVRVLVNGSVAAGTHTVTWDTSDNTGRQLASGIYVGVLETPTGRLLNRVTILR
jgi:flagellar hook assembly protein FlgD